MGAAFRKAVKRPATPSASAAGGGGGGGKKDEAGAFLRQYIFGEGSDGRKHSEFGERASIRSAAARAIDAQIDAVRQTDPALADQMAQHLAFKDLEGLPGREKPYQLYLHETAANPAAAAEKISRSGIPVTADDIAAAAVSTYGGDQEAAVARAIHEGRINQSLTEPHIQGMVHGGRRLAAGLGEQLLADEPNPLAYQVLGVTEDSLRQRYGAAPAAAVADPFQVQPTAAAAATAAAEAPVGGSSRFPDWVPRNRNLTDLESAMAYGGLGIGGAALAAALMNQGAPQADPYDYAAAVAAMNAYA